MIKQILLTLVIVLAASQVNSQTNECSPECGGNGPNHCTDYALATTDPNNCKSCSAGNIGGSGSGNSNEGRLCKKGVPAPGCTASMDSTDNDKCYICSIGYYDPTSNLTEASPCRPCHKNCLSCGGNTENDCYLCNIGLFDPSGSPYSKGSCSTCDSACTHCIGSSTNCVGCCKLGYGRDSNGFCVPIA